jgi:hypothetical protein
MLSCQKDKLTNEKEILIGKWKWIYTEHSTGWCESNPQFYTINAASDTKSYGVEFFEKGRIWFYENGKVIEKYRITFETFEDLSGGNYLFYIKLNNQPTEIIGGSVRGDSLRIKYPYVESDPNCENYLNFFVRE